MAEVVSRDVDVNLDVLARTVLAGDDPVGEGAARRLVQPRVGVPGVPADSTLAPEGLLVLWAENQSGSNESVPVNFLEFVSLIFPNLAEF